MLERILKILRDAGIDVNPIQANLATIAADHITRAEADANAAAQRRSYESKEADLKRQYEGWVSKEDAEKLKLEATEAKKAAEEAVAKATLDIKLESLISEKWPGKVAAAKGVLGAYGHKFKINDKGELELTDANGAPIVKEGKLYTTQSLVDDINKDHSYLTASPQPQPQPGQLGNNNPPAGGGGTTSYGEAAAKRQGSAIQANPYFGGGATT